MNRKLWPLSCVVFLDHLAINVPFMVFAFFNTDSHLFTAHTSYATRSHWYGISLAWMNIVSIIVSPILGYLSDILGRKHLLLFAALGTALAGVLCASGILYTTIGIFLAGRLFSGMCTRTEPFAFAAIADLNAENQRVVQFGYLLLLIAISAVLGPFIGGYLTTFQFSTLNYSAPYLFAAMLGVIAFIIGAMCFEETKKPCTTSLPLKIMQVFSVPQARRLLIILFMTQFAWSMYYQFIQVILKQQYHFSPTHLGYFMSLLAFWIALISGLAIKPLRNLFSEQYLLNMGMQVLFFGSVITFINIFFALNLWLIWLAAILMAAGNLLAYCTILASLSKMYADSQGKVMGISYSVTLGTWAVSGIVGGLLLPLKMYLPLLASALPLFIGLLWARKALPTR